MYQREDIIGKYDRELCELNKKKYRLAQMMIMNQEYKNEYYSIKRAYKKLIKKKKSEYIQERIIDSKNDQKQMWINLKKIVKMDEKSIKYE